MQDGWLIQLAEKSAISQRAAYNWWAAFIKSANLSITPKQASEENRQAFFAWLEAQKQADNCDSQNLAGSQWIDDLAKSTGTPSRTFEVGRLW